MSLVINHYYYKDIELLLHNEGREVHCVFLASILPEMGNSRTHELTRVWYPGAQMSLKKKDLVYLRSLEELASHEENLD